MPAVTESMRRPRKFDFNLVVIGAGSAGLVTSYIAAASKARVALIERDRMGGDCLNTGCVPSKALIRSARIASYLRRADEFGLRAGKVEVDFPRVMERVQSVVQDIEPHDSVERYTDLGVECIAGEARLVSPWHVKVAGRALSTRSIVIASGGEPAVPPIPGLDEVGYLTSDTVWSIRELPRRLLVLGGGPIGSELAQAFARLGSEVTVVEMLPQLLVKEDADVAAMVAARFRAEGIDVLTGFKAQRFERDGNCRIAHCEGPEQQRAIEFDACLVAVGRRANTRDLNLEPFGVQLNSNGTVAVNEHMQTGRANIFACGDAAGPYQLTHAAAHQAWYCAMNALFGQFRKFRVDFSVLPWAIFTDPEVARVGINERDAQEQNREVEVTRYGIDDLDRAIAESEAHGFVKLLTEPGKDRILGVTVVGHHAGDVIAEFVSAMRHNLGARKVLNTIHIYPTLTEANRFVAGEWQKARIAPFLLGIAERYHRWRRR